MLSYLVNDLGADAEAEDKEGFNSVHAATQASHTQCVKVYSYNHCINVYSNDEYSSLCNLIPSGWLLNLDRDTL